MHGHKHGDWCRNCLKVDAKNYTASNHEHISEYSSRLGK